MKYLNSQKTLNIVILKNKNDGFHLLHIKSLLNQTTTFFSFETNYNSFKYSILYCLIK